MMKIWYDQDLSLSSDDDQITGNGFDKDDDSDECNAFAKDSPRP